MGIPANNNERVRICVCTPGETHSPLVGALIKQLQAQQIVDYDRVEKPEDVPAAMERSGEGVAIITLFQKEGLLGILNCISKLEERVKNGTLRIIIITNLDHPKVNSVLRSKGISDILELNMTIKAFNLRLKNALTLVRQAKQKTMRVDRTHPTTGNGIASSRARTDSSNEIIWDTAVEHACDFWTVTHKKNARFVMDKWLIDIFGPGPSAGTWTQSEFQYRNEKGWEWRPWVPTDNTFQRESGSWVFFGKIPEFVWSKNSWALVGKFPKLAFFRDGEIQYERIYTEEKDDGKLHILENSEVSATYLTVIQNSLQASVKTSAAAPQEGYSSQLSFEASSPRSDSNTLSLLNSDSADQPGWKDHLGARGVDIGIRNHSIPTEKPKSSWGEGNLLQPTNVGLEIGLDDLNTVGIKIDRNAFESVKLSLRLKTKNQNLLLSEVPLQLLDFTQPIALFDMSNEMVNAGDKITIEAKIKSQDRNTQMEILGSVNRVDQLDLRRNIIELAFENDQAELLDAVLQVFQDRQLELERFFRTAKGT